MSIEAMKLALEALNVYACKAEHKRTHADNCQAEEAITALRQAIEQAQKQEQKVDWEKLYRLEVKKKEALVAKYERDIKPLTRIIPMAQPEQAQKQEPDKYAMDIECTNCGTKQSGILTVNTTSPQRQPEQEPVAWMFQHEETGRMNYVSNDGMNTPELFLKMNPRYVFVCALYTSPPQRHPEQEPINIRERWNIERDGDDLLVCFNDHEKGEGCRYERYVLADTSSSQRQPLTAEQIQYAFRTNSVMVDNGNAYMVAGKRAINITRAIEAAHGIKGEA